MLRYNRWKCPNCGNIVVKKTFCPECNFSFPQDYPDEWKCPFCGSIVKNNTYCEECFYPKRLSYPKLWHCPKCGELNSKTPNCICGYYGKDIRVKKRIRKNKYNIMLVLFSIIVPLSLLGFMFLSISFAGPEESLFANYSGNNVFFVYPNWNLLNKSNTFLRIYDYELGRELIYLNSVKVFNSLENEKNRILSRIREGYGGGLSIYKNYGFGKWEVSCYNLKNDINGCLGIRYCHGNVSFIYLTNFRNRVDENILKGVLDSFICG